MILQISKTVRAIISRKKLAILILSAATALSANVLAQPGNGRVATLEFNPGILIESEAFNFSNRWRSGLVNQAFVNQGFVNQGSVNNGAFAALEQGKVESGLKVQWFQPGAPVVPERAPKIDRKLKADDLIAGRLDSVNASYPGHTRMFGFETGAALGKGDIAYQDGRIGSRAGNMDDVPLLLAQAEGEGVPTEGAGPGGKSSWPLWTGSIALVVSVALQLSAVASHEEAATKANQASADGDRDSFDEADIQREEAESQQTLALVLGVAGAGLILYYLLSGDSSDSSSNRGIESIAPPIVIGSHKGTFFIWFNTKW